MGITSDKYLVKKKKEILGKKQTINNESIYYINLKKEIKYYIHVHLIFLCILI